MSQCQLVHEPQRRKKKNRELAPRLQSATPAQFIELLATLRIRTYESGDARMRGFLQGCRSRGLKRRPLLQTSSPLKPENQPEDSHRSWHSKRGHFNLGFVRIRKLPREQI